MLLGCSTQMRNHHHSAVACPSFSRTFAEICSTVAIYLCYRRFDISSLKDADFHMIVIACYIN